MEICSFIDWDEWGIGLSVGKTRYGKTRYRVFISIHILCFISIIWFGGKELETDGRSI